MSYSEADLLTRTIQSVREYQGERPPVHIEQLFYQLNECDQSRNQQLWGRLKTELANNHQLNEPAQVSYLHRPRFIKKGYWWWDASIYGISSTLT
ncbi:MAG: hypothetical protein ACQETE_03450 [Bacteroidota bacterium]